MKRFLMIIAVFAIMSFCRDSYAGEFDPKQYKKDCETIGVKPWISSLKELENRREQIKEESFAKYKALPAQHVYNAFGRIENIIKKINELKKDTYWPFKRKSKVLKYGFFTKEVEIQEGYEHSYIDSPDEIGFSLARSYTYTGLGYKRLLSIACLFGISAYYYRNDLRSFFNI